MKWDMDTTALVLAGVGAVNWGLVAFAGINLVDKIAAFIPYDMTAKIIYGAVAAGGALVLVKAFK